jgi:hypothetical protein
LLVACAAPFGEKKCLTRCKDIQDAEAALLSELGI